jgi:hypothetical protein
MAVKLGTLYPDGHMDDLGEVNGGMRPGADSTRRAEEYGWELVFDGSDTEQIHVAKRVEDTGELQYVFGIRVDDMTAATGEGGRTIYTSELIQAGGYLTDKDALRDLILKHPLAEVEILEWYDEPGFSAESLNYGDEAYEWAEEQITEEELNVMYTQLFLIPVRLPEEKMRELIQVDEDFFDEHLLPTFEEHGDWRALAMDLVMCGAGVSLMEWSGTAEEGEWPEKDIQVAKEAALQVAMMVGFLLDRRLNAIGDTGWDRLRELGLIFCGDEVVWSGGAGEERHWVAAWNGPEGTYTLTDKGGDGEFEADPIDVRALTWREMLKRRIDAQNLHAGEEEAKEAEDPRAMEESQEDPG